MELIDYSSSIWSIIPPLLALALAIITRKVLLSLSVGILVGAAMLANFEPLNTLVYLKNNIASLFIKEGGLNSNNINILLFLLLLGVLTALLSMSGSNRAFAEWAQKHIKGRRGAKLVAASLVFITFIDDYFHSLAVGAIARPITEVSLYFRFDCCANVRINAGIQLGRLHYYAYCRFISHLLHYRLLTHWGVYGNERHELLRDFLNHHGLFCCLFFF